MRIYELVNKEGNAKSSFNDEGQFVVDLGEISEELFGLLEEKLVYDGIMDMRNFY